MMLPAMRLVLTGVSTFMVVMGETYQSTMPWRWSTVTFRVCAPNVKDI